MGIFTSGFISFLFILTLAWMFSMHLKERPFLELCVVLYVFLRGWTDWQHCSVCLHHTSFLSTFSTHYWGKSAEISVTVSVSVPSQFYEVILHVLWSSAVRCTYLLLYLLNELILLLLWNVPSLSLTLLSLL